MNAAVAIPAAQVIGLVAALIVIGRYGAEFLFGSPGGLVKPLSGRPMQLAVAGFSVSLYVLAWVDAHLALGIGGPLDSFLAPLALVPALIAGFGSGVGSMLLHDLMPSTSGAVSQGAPQPVETSAPVSNSVLAVQTSSVGSVEAFYAAVNDLIRRVRAGALTPNEGSALYFALCTANPGITPPPMPPGYWAGLVG